MVDGLQVDVDGERDERVLERAGVLQAHRLDYLAERAAVARA